MGPGDGGVLVPAHVTVTYPEETGDDEMLLRRASRCVALTRAFRLRMGGVFAEDDGRGGVFFAVEDAEQGWARLRRDLLAPPFRSLDFPPHVTVVHPGTSRHGPACLAELAGRRLHGEFEVSELLFTETTDTVFRVLRRFELGST
ncbi:2'-5' RNA ligase family protein [Actinopolymorpha pittospori]|uniref:2'-5' RNA ligase n=1 Tax=Actinopolymorpha pittospori TaxID=648752 RepID=A0A927RDB0_9ACTN|nr:2'-5' RNA ligase [Actinopolymorpha pittospori]